MLLLWENERLNRVKAVLNKLLVDEEVVLQQPHIQAKQTLITHSRGRVSIFFLLIFCGILHICI